MAEVLLVLASIATIAGFFYMITKDSWPYIRRKQRKKEVEYKYSTIQVDLNYPKESGCQDQWEKDGFFDFGWVSSKNIESKKHQGYEVLYITNGEKREKTSLEILNSSGIVELIFMGKNKK